MTSDTNTPPEARADEWVGLSALCASHDRSFADALEHYTRYAKGAHLGLRRSEAAELVRRWREEDAARTAAEQRVAARQAEERDRRRALDHGQALLQALSSSRTDQFMTEEALARESEVERLAMLERRLKVELDLVAQALDAWTAWKRDNAPLAVAVEELARAGAVAPEPEQFAIPKPDWIAEAAESRRLEELERAREREVLKAGLRAELAAERGA